MSEGLAQGSYMAAKVGFEPATFRTQGTDLTTEPHNDTQDIKAEFKLVLQANRSMYVSMCA